MIEKLKVFFHPVFKKLTFFLAKGEEKFIELLRPGEYFIAARGGKGGKGNYRFVSRKNRSPDRATGGRGGEVFFF